MMSMLAWPIGCRSLLSQQRQSLRKTVSVASFVRWFTDNHSGPRSGLRRLEDPRPRRSTVPVAFVFDIDGVLLHSERVIPAARRVLSILEGSNSLKMPIPYVFLTNGGGIDEEDRSKKLSRQLGVSIPTNRIIQAHTLLKDYAAKYTHEAVLVLGGKYDIVRKVAEGYGFKQVYTTLDIHAWNSSVWPFHELTPEERASTRVSDADFSTMQFSSILVFHDPRNWSLDIQIVCDILQSGGFVGKVPSLFNQKPVELLFCNPDLLWRADFPRPRLGQGAFKEALQAVYKALTGLEYQNIVQYGKPTRETYAFAEKTLTDILEEMYGHRLLPPIYMIGDNPASDIAGANAAQWNSVLVHTGVYDPSTGKPVHQPTSEAYDVEAAVMWALDRELPREEARL